MRHRDPSAVVGAVSVGLVLVLAALGVALGPPSRLAPPLGLGVSFALGFVPVGLFLLLHRPHSRTARFTALTGLLAVLGLAAVSWSGTTAGAWATQWTWWPPLAVAPTLLLGFPDGAAGPRARRLGRWMLAAGATSTLVLAAAAALAPRTLLTDSTAALPAPCRPLLLTFAVLGAVSVAGLLASLVVLLRRARARRGATRAQVLWLAPTAALLPIGIALDALDVPFALTPAVLALPVGLGAAILEHRLDDLDQDVPRGAVRIALTLGVVGLYAGALLLLQRLTGSVGPGAVLTLAVLAVLLDPARAWLQRRVERLLFGDRDAPFEVLTALGRRLAAVATPEEMLRTSAVAIVEALRVPRARVAVEVDGGEVVVADVGHADTDPVPFALVKDGGRVGELTVWTRRRGDDLGSRERGLLTEVARQAAEAAEAHRLTLALESARERLVLTREEERLRLRRDFHDGVGPVIAGVRMQLHAARPHLDGREGQVVEEVLADLGELGRSVREIIDGLRPAALDLGLAGAVHRTAEALLAGRTVEVDVRGRLDDLHPAVEVAAYRIVAEALTNVARHSGAHRVQVALERADDLHVRVRDDGGWAGPVGSGGVGTTSMRARAEELGGRFDVVTDDRGTLLEAVLPLGRQAHRTHGESGTGSR
ncbi:sensor histidine kinase [Phycicoccus avicenniae]|uniref:sensor histidine kinase n=1 Tax=Phycicoccus avicenniae TaxID=2828860 RepID=UPI003D2AD24C